MSNPVKRSVISACKYVAVLAVCLAVLVCAIACNNGSGDTNRETGTVQPDETGTNTDKYEESTNTKPAKPKPPVWNPPETDPPETDPPETDPPETEPPQKNIQNGGELSEADDHLKIGWNDEQ